VGWWPGRVSRFSVWIPCRALGRLVPAG